MILSASAILKRFGNVLDIVKKDGFKPDSIVYTVVEGENLETMSKSTGLAIVELTTCFSKLNPDIVVTVADRYETMATAILCKLYEYYIGTHPRRRSYRID